MKILSKHEYEKMMGLENKFKGKQHIRDKIDLSTIYISDEDFDTIRSTIIENIVKSIDNLK